MYTAGRVSRSFAINKAGAGTNSNLKKSLLLKKR
jgi:hypothetical protein